MGRDFRKNTLVKALRYVVLIAVCVLLVQSKPTYGQVDEGSITGTVQDASGAVIPNADVVLVNTDQGITLQTKSNASGTYTFSPVRIGHYTLTASAQGFAKTTQKNLVLQVAQTLQVNLSLKLGGTTETVEVNTAPPVLQTEEGSVGQVIGETQVHDLPLNGRNFTFLAQLGAGMQTPQADGRGNAANGAAILQRSGREKFSLIKKRAEVAHMLRLHTFELLLAEFLCLCATWTAIQENPSDFRYCLGAQN